MRRIALLITVAALNAGGVEASVIVPIDVPGAIVTRASATDGGTVVGRFQSADGVEHGFVYDGATFSAIDVPGANAVTQAFGIDGGTVVGDYLTTSDPVSSGSTTRGFVFDGSTYTTIAYPGSDGTNARAIENGILVGTWQEDVTNVRRGFTFDGTSFVSLEVPGSAGTRLQDISQGVIVGGYQVAGSPDFLGFSYDGSFSTLSVPEAISTLATGVSGDLIVGWYDTIDSGGTNPERLRHGFLYDGSAYVTFEVPDAIETAIQGTDGTSIVGWYRDSNGIHGFRSAIEPVPEPASLLVWACCAGISAALALRPRRPLTLCHGGNGSGFQRTLRVGRA